MIYVAFRVVVVKLGPAASVLAPLRLRLVRAFEAGCGKGKSKGEGKGMIELRKESQMQNVWLR